MKKDSDENKVENLISSPNLVDDKIIDEQKNSDYLKLMAHQMQQSIGIMRGYLDLFFRKPNKNDKKIIEEELLCLSHLVSQVLKLSYLDAGFTQMSFEKIELLEFVKNFVCCFQKKIKNKKIVILPCEEDFLWVEIDKYQMAEVLEILLDNAIKHGKIGAEIQLNLVSEPSFVEILVKNEGVAITSSFQEKIFTPFSHSGNNKGSGLGLAIAKRVIVLHQGEISFDSNAEFTIFKIKINRILLNKN